MSEKKENGQMEAQVGQNGQVLGSTNGHAKHQIDLNFKYKFDSGMMAINRYTELALKERVLQRFGDSLVSTGNIVYAFNHLNKTWSSQKQNNKTLRWFVEFCAKEMILEPEFLMEMCSTKEGVSDDKRKREEIRWTSMKLVSQIAQAISHSDLQHMPINRFDSDPYLFYAANGVVDLRSGELRDAQPSDYLLRQASVVYDANAKCPYFEAFLGDIYRDNEEPQRVIDFIQEVFGYSLTGSNSEQVIFIHTGDGANGKSRLLKALRELTGNYCTRLNSGALIKSKYAVGKEIERIGAKIEGSRVVVIDDMDTKTQWNDSLVKGLTDTEIASRRLYEEERDIPNHAKVHIGCNQTPTLDGSSYAVTRRLCILEYPRTFPIDPKKVEEIDSKIIEELPGIFNWARAGLVRVLGSGSGNINKPEEVVARVQTYEEANTEEWENVPMEAMFESCEDSENLPTLQECMRHLNQCFTGMGLEEGRMSHDSLSRKFSKAGFQNKRSTKNGKKLRRYYVKFITPLESKKSGLESL